MQKLKLSPEFIGVLQAAGFLVYASGVAWLMINGNTLFGDNPHIFVGPLLFLSVFVFSAMFSAGILLGYLSSPPFFGQWFVNGLLVKSHPKFLWRHL
jgi:hypothetical protein